MAKPKSPLLSLGARGTIADTLTFQKRGGDTIARRKPIPTDPKSSAQLAQRQVYRDAVDTWRALSPEEQQAWRGVCPGLTAYQCFMKSELKYVPPVPPPEEYTEEQTEHNAGFQLNITYPRTAQRLIIPPGREITKLGFWLQRELPRSGDIHFRIRRVSDDGVELEKLWGDAGDIPLVPTYEEVAFVTPKEVAGDSYLSIEYDGADPAADPVSRYSNADPKPAESLYYFNGAVWTEFPGSDLAYRYKYYLV